MTRRQSSMTVGLAQAQALLGKKWALQILLSAMDGASRFNDFLAHNPGLSDRVLAGRLRDLVVAGLLSKEGKGKRVRYTLTQFGHEAQPLVVACAQFGVRAHSRTSSVGMSH